MELRRVNVQFLPDGSIEVAVTYAHGEYAQPPNPGTKGRLRTARKGAIRALTIALEDLAQAQEKNIRELGFATDTKVTTDTLAVERG